MDSSSKISGVIPAKENTIRSTSKESTGQSENINPNISSPGLKLPNSSVIAKKSAIENPPRKFVIVKKKSNEESDAAETCEKCKATGKSKVFGFSGEMEGNEVIADFNRENEDEVVEVDRGLKRSRDKMLESGKVMRLVRAFEDLMMSKLGGDDENGAEEVKEDTSSKWKLCGFQQTSNASDFVLTPESLGLDSNSLYPLDSVPGRISTVASAGGRKIRRSGIESTGNRTRRHWKRKPAKATTQKPFMLRTEERGRYKEVEFMKKLRQRMEEEEKKRIPIAQLLPWTTEEPERLVKPAVKETTRPVDLVLHSDVRAVERSEFDNQVATKLNTIEQYRMERERQQKLQEEEEIRRPRKELVFKAKPLPFFDKPFIPKRSGKHLTVPKEPKFHIPQHKKIRCGFCLEDLHAHPQ